MEPSIDFFCHAPSHSFSFVGRLNSMHWRLKDKKRNGVKLTLSLFHFHVFATSVCIWQRHCVTRRDYKAMSFGYANCFRRLGLLMKRQLLSFLFLFTQWKIHIESSRIYSYDKCLSRDRVFLFSLSSDYFSSPRFHGGLFLAVFWGSPKRNLMRQQIFI